MRNKYFGLTMVMFIILNWQPLERVAADGEVPHSHNNEETEFTDYHITLDEAVDIQVNAKANPITDIYRGAPSYVHFNDVKIVSPIISVPVANVRTAPSLEGEIAFDFPKMAPIFIVGIEKNIGNSSKQEPLTLTKLLQERFETVEWQEHNRSEGDVWYKIAYQTNTYFVQTSDVRADQIEIKTNTKVRQGPAKSNHAFGKLEKGDTLTIAGLEPNWVEVYYKSWRIPTPEDVKVQIDPNGEDGNLFQHIRLDATIDVPASELDKVLEDKGVLEGQGEAFIAAGKEHGINEAYLIAHALLESGHGTSALATGVEVGVNGKGEPVIVTESNREELKKIKATYNMFGIGAADSCPLECGAKTAYENKWFTPETAIKDGAAWIGEGYIYNEFEQNTLYKMKWNPKMGEGQQWKQYATDIGWAEKQTARIKDIYEQLNDPKYYYDIPMYAEK
ncbi:glucosaminidase domain-containing protein [Pseudogracilibacillus auburnensis]|uniref:glucosaminidase domain-containing protein n=1 Tax=Pseudogracilibacillus auburnensis TaxID=1494959 RepID=UPI001A9594CE|nr:N-acetylglucosaminidase [Pseudogracilibacillus auburnensis]MBO1003239.1 N-acetylglucosaminidase [Pseudogracilibacillus auburnensis]